MNFSSRILLISLLLASCNLSFGFQGDIKPINDTTEYVEENYDELGRSTPRGTIKGYFEALRNKNDSLLQLYFHLSPLEADRTDIDELLKNFSTLLDIGGKVEPTNLVSDDLQGDINDGLKPSMEEVGVIYYKQQEIPVLLEQVSGEDDRIIWLFSSKTLKRIPTDVEISNNIFIDNIFESETLKTDWKGAPISHWIGILVLIVFSYAIALVISKIVKWIIQSAWKGYDHQRHNKLLKTFLIPLRLVITVALIVYFSRTSDISILVRHTFSVVNISLLWAAFFLFIWLLIGTISIYGESRLREKNNLSGLSVILFLRNGAKFVLLALALILILDTFGVNVTAGLAALGIGGIALALGAQKTIENFVGSITVVFDQPIRVGDFCKFGDTVGTVESIGMRSTRIRTLDRTLITIPNGDFSSRSIENYSQRDMFLYRKQLGLRYETSSNQMRYILVEMRKLLYAHPKVDRDPARVRFLGYGSDSLQVEIFAYCHAVDYNEYLAIQEDINLRLAKVVEDSGSGFAFPSQTVYLSRDQGLSDVKSKNTEKKVQDWVDKGELEMPDFDEETIENLKDSLKYPPEGSKSNHLK